MRREPPRRKTPNVSRWRAGLKWWSAVCERCPGQPAFDGFMQTVSQAVRDTRESGPFDVLRAVRVSSGRVGFPTIRVSVFYMLDFDESQSRDGAIEIRRICARC